MVKIQNVEFTLDKQEYRRRHLSGVIGLVAGLGLLSLGIVPVRADAPAFLPADNLSGSIDNPGDDAETSPPANAPADDANSGPVRMVRFSALQGDVTWRGGTEGDWTNAARNMPIRQGAQIWVSENSRAEIQFDDGSRLRLDSNTLVTLQTLYSDTQGEFTEITLNDGLIALNLKTKFSTYQVNTPLASVKASGPTRLRVGAGDGIQVGVWQGSAKVEGNGNSATLETDDYLDVTDENAAYSVVDLPRPDDWDRWNEERDQELNDQRQHASYHYVPTNIALCADDLDTYGTWRSDPVYGHVWVPTVTDPNWRPYYDGHWTWVEPFGWTWISNEPWGWAPYHYGTWVHGPYGWGWVPGPSEQYWSPGVVAFYQSGGEVAWCPLAPHEVRYPSRLVLGFRGGNWALFFSVGGAAVYYPTAHNICVARPWSPTYVNHVTYVTNVTVVQNVTINRNTYITNNRFISVNTRAAGATMVSTQAFGTFDRGGYRPVARESANSFFAHAEVVGAPVSGRPIAGPQAVRVTHAAFSPTRSFVPSTRVPAAILTRTVYRAPLPTRVAHSAPMPGQRFSNAPARNTRPPAPRVAGTVTGVPNRPQGNHPINPVAGRTGQEGGVPSAGINNGAPTVRRSSGLDEYLRQRNGGQATNGQRTPGGTPAGQQTPVGTSGQRPSGGTPSTRPPVGMPSGQRPQQGTPSGQPNPVPRERPTTPYSPANTGHNVPPVERRQPPSQAPGEGARRTAPRGSMPQQQYRPLHSQSPQHQNAPREEKKDRQEPGNSHQ